jgi:hypothetical protein
MSDFRLKPGVEGFTYINEDDIAVQPNKSTCTFQSVTGVSQDGEQGLIEAAYGCTTATTDIYQVLHDAAAKACATKPCPQGFFADAFVRPAPAPTSWTESHKFSARRWDNGWRLNE